VELRQIEPLAAITWPQRLDKVSMMLELPATEAELSKQLGSKLRSQIKRAEKENPEVLWGGAELLPQFFRVFSQAMHELGTPVYSPQFFDIACAAFGDLARVLVIKAAGQPQTAAIIVRHGTRIEVPWAAATPEAKRGALNMRMYWEMLKHCVSVGARVFDFGRSSVDSGTYRFKAQWGAKPVQLHWHYWLPAGAEIPKLNQGNPKFALAARAWRRLPLWAANTIGPQIVRNLP
jgi:serine/alanine adding enzyme